MTITTYCNGPAQQLLGAEDFIVAITLSLCYHICSSFTYKLIYLSVFLTLGIGKLLYLSDKNVQYSYSQYLTTQIFFGYRRACNIYLSIRFSRILMYLQNWMKDGLYSGLGEAYETPALHSDNNPDLGIQNHKQQPHIVLNRVQYLDGQSISRIQIT